MLLNAVIPVLQSPASIVWFLRERRGVRVLSPSYFRAVSVEYHEWVQELAARWSVPILTPPSGVRREEWVDSFYRKRRDKPGVAVILKSRENGRVAAARATRGQPHIEIANRFVWQYYFYLLDADWGRMFLRICPYFPFNARVCLNGHEWLACRMRREELPFRQCGNAFLACCDPPRLQALSDSLAPHHVWNSVHRWLAILVPFFSDRERRNGTWGHRLFASQVEYCTNLVFHRRASLDAVMERLLDLNRTIGRPHSLSVIFGKRITKRTVGGLKTQITDHGFAHPAIRSHYKRGSIKQYVRDHVLLRTEVTSYHTPDLGVNKSIEHLPRLRQVMQPINERYLDVQQDVLETYVDRGHLQQLRQPTVSENGRRIPGLKQDDPRLLALMQALVRFAPLASGGLFRTADLHEAAATAQGKTTDSYTLSQLRYDLGKLRAKGLIEKVNGTQSYRLMPEGYRLCVLFLKLFHKVFAPLTSAILHPLASPKSLSTPNPLDRLYAAVDQALQHLCHHVGLQLVA
jgi:hypothetical protein